MGKSVASSVNVQCVHVLVEVYGASNLFVGLVVVLTNSFVVFFLLFQVGPRQLPPRGGPGY